MALSAQQVAYLKTRYQRFTVEIVPFDAISWSFSQPAAGAITWRPMPLLSPRFAFTTGDSVTIDGNDSVIRPTTGVDTVAFSKGAGPGTVTDNGDKTCTVSYGGGDAAGITRVDAVATSGGQTATGYAFVYHSDGAAAPLTAIVAEIRGLSGSLSSGEWQGEMVLRGDYSSVLTDDGRDQPILMHVSHTWDGATSTFGGYKRDANTFVLMVVDCTITEKYGDYYTTLKLATPHYILSRMSLSEMKFKTGGASAGYYTTADLTPTDVAYYLCRECCNYYQYFNASLWNNTITIDNFNVRADNDVWTVIKECHDYNFGMVYFNRWSNLNGKPDPRVRPVEWFTIASDVYDRNNPLTAAHMLDYTIIRNRTDGTHQVLLQAVGPDMAIYEGQYPVSPEAGIGERVEIDSLIADSAITLGNWGTYYYNYLSNEYELDFTLAMGHELNPGDLFRVAALTPTVTGTSYDEFTWDGLSGYGMLCTDVDYRFDFARGFWTRAFHATRIEHQE